MTATGTATAGAMIEAWVEDFEEEAGGEVPAGSAMMLEREVMSVVGALPSDLVIIEVTRTTEVWEEVAAWISEGVALEVGEGVFVGVVEGRERDVPEAWSVVTEAAESEKPELPMVNKEALEEGGGEDDAVALAEDAEGDALLTIEDGEADALPPDVLPPDPLPPDAKTIWRLAIWNRSLEV